MKQKIETFCEVKVLKLFSNQHREDFERTKVPNIHFAGIPPFVSTCYFVSVNYGDSTGWSALKTQAGEIYSCNSQVEAMNFMSEQGWKLVKTYRTVDANRYYVYNSIFKKYV